MTFVRLICFLKPLTGKKEVKERKRIGKMRCDPYAGAWIKRRCRSQSVSNTLFNREGERKRGREVDGNGEKNRSSGNKQYARTGVTGAGHTSAARRANRLFSLREKGMRTRGNS